MRVVKFVLPLVVSCVALAGCETLGRMQGEPGTGGVRHESGQVIDITGGVIDANAHAAPVPIISNDVSVSVYSLDGPVQNPLSVERYRSVADNTTAGGYTVFDESVKIYPLGNDTPAFVPAHAVPPYGAGAAPSRASQPTSLTHSSLPPVPTVAVGAADPFANPPVGGMLRQPAMLIADENAPMNIAPRAPQGHTQGGVSAGRKSSPLLTGY